FCQRRADGLVARGRDQRERKFVGSRIGLIDVQACVRLVGERVRIQVNLLIRCSRKDVDKLNRASIERWFGGAVVPHLVTRRSWQAIEDVEHLLEFTSWIRVFTQARQLEQVTEYFRIRPRLADGLNDRAAQTKRPRSV